MKKINPILVGLILFFGCMFNAQDSIAQHLLEYDGQKKVIKVVAEQGNSLYYRNWPDTVDGPVKAVWVSEITRLKPLAAGEVDSVYAQLIIEAEQKQRREVEAKMVKREIMKENGKLTIVEVDANTAIAANRMDFGGGFAIGLKRKNGIAILVRSGVDFTNQGQGFIYTTQIPLGLQVNYDMLSLKVLNGIPFIQVMGGYNYVISGKFDKTRERVEQYLDYTNDQLANNAFVCIGGGLMYKNRMKIGLSYKLQGSNVKFPEIDYIHFLMVKLSILL